MFHGEGLVADDFHAERGRIHILVLARVDGVEDFGVERDGAHQGRSRVLYLLVLHGLIDLHLWRGLLLGCTLCRGSCLLRRSRRLRLSWCRSTCHLLLSIFDLGDDFHKAGLDDLEVFGVDTVRSRLLQVSLFFLGILDAVLEVSFWREKLVCDVALDALFLVIKRVYAIFELIPERVVLHGLGEGLATFTLVHDDADGADLVDRMVLFV